MKSFKKFISEELLTEKYFKINKDVDYVYNFLFKKFVDNFVKTGEINESLISSDMITGYEFAKQSKNKDIKKAHELNHLDVIMYSKIKDVNAYIPADDWSTARILLTPSHKAVRDMFKNNGKGIIKHIQKGSQSYFENEISEARIKGSIHHEISHWMNDSLHGKHITKRIQTHSGETPVDYKKHMNKNVKRNHEFLTDYELDAQIHAMIQYRRKNKKAWDAATSIEDLLKMMPFFKPLKDTVTDKELIQWKKYILKRLARENILGKKIRK